jgi:hypothetical protein
MSKYNILVTPEDKHYGAVWLDALRGKLYYFFREEEIPEESLLDYIENEKHGIIDNLTTFSKYSLFNARSVVEAEGYAMCKQIDGSLPNTVYKFWPFEALKDICKEPSLDRREFERVIHIERSVAKGGAFVSHTGHESGACSLGFRYERIIRCADKSVQGDYQYFELPHQEDFLTYKPKNSDKRNRPNIYGSVVKYTAELYEMIEQTAMSFRELNDRLLDIIKPESLISISDSGVKVLPLTTKVGSE